MLLEVDNLSVRFAGSDGPVDAVRGIGFSLAAGEALGIVGESGSGKSQTVLALLGLLDANGRASGSARYRGQELIGLGERKLRQIRGARIAMVFQDPMTSLHPQLRIGTQMTEVLRQHRGTSRRAAKARAIEMLDAVRIPDAAKRLRYYPHQFSGGMRQRVMIAMSLLCEPDILIADEPTTALDVTVQAQILDLIAELRARTATALLLITHDLGVVAGTCDRVLVLRDGIEVERGDADSLFADPRHPYTQALLAAVPRLDRSLPSNRPGR